ncbi:NAD(P)/FAD-dependent oxidoreductase [Robiginitalea sp. SC105]|uniref:NAD(P)/FAD-dependent oxidoreductase n=1 Tax=Robiginitalea sp. SC105 TaxID=2762332 RepID=UPI0016397D47|nr:NAD(P)/FAD-dependent oxidoreductase [Robiginitalea sp. SC105]MBC2838662.1 NAD(P)/FAD-dependent oxidoreductase [Robiginitalea sp. SC105]
MNIPESDLPRIAVVGGGFAGISLAKRLRGLPVQLVLVDRQNYHNFQPLLYQVSTGGLEPDSIAYPIRKILKRLDNFYFRWAEVESVDPDRRILHTDKGDLGYDYLVLATGTRTNYFGNKQMEKFARPMKTIPQALDIRSLALQNLEQADYTESDSQRRALMNFCIIGAGPTGVELAGAFAELKRHVFPRDYKHLDVAEMEIHLFEGAGQVLPPMSDTASRKGREFLEGLGVQIHLDTLVDSYDGELLTTKDGKEFRTANCIWTAGVTGALVPGFPEGSVDGRTGRLKVDNLNRVRGYETVFAVGDIALMQTANYPGGHPQMAQPAMQQGAHLAKNLKFLLEGKPMRPFTYKDKGSMATIGRNKAVVDLPKFQFGGFAAWFIWMFIHLMSLVGFRNKVVVFFNWVYNYINYDKAARLIVRPFRRKAEKDAAMADK